MNHTTSPVVCSEVGFDLLADILDAFTEYLHAVGLSAGIPAVSCVVHGAF